MQPLSCPGLPWPCLCAGAFWCLTLIPNVFSCVQKPDLAWKILLFKSRKEPCIVSWVILAGLLSHTLHLTKVWKWTPGNVYSTQWWNPYPNVGLQWKSILDSCVLKPDLVWKALLFTNRIQKQIWARVIWAWWRSHKLHIITVCNWPPVNVYSTQWWDTSPN